jgi:hypothetical protein
MKSSSFETRPSLYINIWYFVLLLSIKEIWISTNLLKIHLSEGILDKNLEKSFLLSFMNLQRLGTLVNDNIIGCVVESHIHYYVIIKVNCSENVVA